MIWPLRYFRTQRVIGSSVWCMPWGRYATIVMLPDGTYRVVWGAVFYRWWVHR